MATKKQFVLIETDSKQYIEVYYKILMSDLISLDILTQIYELSAILE